MNHTCAQCHKNFLIRDQDRDFYTMMKSPLPLYCPDCRVMRRLAFRNERTLYKRTCDLCQKEIISVYPIDTSFPVYCHTCWWSDKWNPHDFALDYDANKPFLEQFKDLQSTIPRIALLVVNSINSEYTNNAGQNKDCYLVFASDTNEHCFYSRLVMRSKSCIDCTSVYDSELCYECVDCRQCFKCFFTENSQSSTDLLFCYDMKNSNNCIFSTHGRNMSYTIYNQKVTKEEFEAKKKEIFSSYENVEKAKEEFKQLKESTFVKYASQIKCENVTGDYMYNCHDGIKLFDVSDTKNCSYMADSMDHVDSMDCNNCYIKCERHYDMMSLLGGSNNKHGIYVMYCTECEYCDSCYNSQSLFGCIGLSKESYCILNKKYSKEEYILVKNQIVESMKKDGTYGQFFPPSMSPFGYNETLAKEYYPLTRDEALSFGYRWQENNTGTFGKETLTEEHIPASIVDTTESILSEILVCNECDRNYRITQGELELYHRLGIPVPHKDFECRHQNRVSKRTPRKLWQRSCMNVGCTNTFETAFSEERKEKIFCEECYKKEVL